jgi:hypothetical protein
MELVQGRPDEDLKIPFGYAPAVFSRQLLENDFKKNLQSYEWAPDERAWGIAKEAFRLLMRSYLFGGLQSFEWASNHADKTTSPGYPLNLKYKDKGSALIGEDALLREIVEQIFTRGSFDVQFEYKPGKFMRWNHVYYQVSPKGELRTVDKLLSEDLSKRKTRTFMCGDLVLYLVTVMCYGEQHDMFLSMASGAEWSAVGMTPWYGGWNRMAGYLQSRSGSLEQPPNMWCFDVSHMEASVNDNIQTVIDRVRNESLVTYSRRALEFVHETNVALYVIGVTGWLYLILGKNPSGKFLTADDNTLALMLGGLYTIACDCQTAAEVVRVYWDSPAKMFGDDSVIQDRPWVHKMVERMRHLGFELKLECPVGPLRDARFLNAGFWWSGSMWYFKPNFDKVRASIFFLWKSRSWRLAYVKVCAYRQLVYPYKLYRDEADRLLRYIITNHDDDMRNEKQLDATLSYESTRASLLSDARTEFLHSGAEVRLLHAPLLYGGRAIRDEYPDTVALTYESFGDLNVMRQK